MLLRLVSACLGLAPLAAALPQEFPWQDLGLSLPGAGAAPTLSGFGGLHPDAWFQLSVAGAQPGAPLFHVLGLAQASLPLFAGTLVPFPDAVVAGVADGAGRASLLAKWPASAPVGTQLVAQTWILESAAPIAVSATNGIVATGASGPEWGAFPAQWIWGQNCQSEVKIQVHAYNPDFYILRQSICTNFEAPFFYLLMGEQKALLLDTGAGGIQLASTVTSLVAQWAAARSIPTPQLVVVHSHAHGDHVQGDSQFNAIPGVQVAGTSVNAVTNFFGFAPWPTDVVTLDLGGRLVDVLGIPGHQAAHIALYDRRTATLLTGDSLYPGRLYVNGASSQGNWNVFKTSVQRLVDFTNPRPLAWVLGTHIEMSNNPGVNFPIGARVHPNERRLELTRAHLLLLDAELDALPTPTLKVTPDFIIYPIN